MDRAFLYLPNEVHWLSKGCIYLIEFHGKNTLLIIGSVCAIILILFSKCRLARGLSHILFHTITGLREWVFASAPPLASLSNPF